MTTTISSKLSSKAIDALADQIAEISTHLDAATHTLLSRIREFDRAGGHGRQGFKTCAQWLSWRIGMAPGPAREHVRVANALADLPAVDDALRTGAISYSKVRAITRVATSATEAYLVDLAMHTTASQLEVICRKYATTQPSDPRTEADRRYVTRRHLEDGMVMVCAVLRPDEAARAFGVLDKLAAREAAASANVPAGTSAATGDVCRVRPTRFDRADAFMSVFDAIARGDSPERAPIELVVIREPDGTGMTSDGTALSKATVERLSCDAGIVELTVDASGNALDVGRKHRTVTTAQKRALAHRDPHCRFPGCANRVFLDAHHIDHWSHGGDTSLANCIRMCTFHHALLHEGFTCKLVEGELAFFDREGRRVVAVPLQLRPAPLGLPALHELHASLEIDEDTGANTWDGTHFSYGPLIELLCARSDLSNSPQHEELQQFAVGMEDIHECEDQCHEGEPSNRG